jgi:uncharacterized membrane protein
VTSDRFRLAVSWVLATGVAISAILIALGFAGSFIVGWRGSLVGDPHVDTPITDFGGLLTSLSALRPQAIGQFGLIVLVATPILRVATSLVAFVLERDTLYVSITAVVLGILMSSAVLIR